MAKPKLNEDVKAPAETLAVRILRAVKHDGMELIIGTLVEIEIGAARALIAVGAAEQARAAVAAIETPPPADPTA